MRRFIRQSLLFVIPIIGLFLPPLALSILDGEYLPLSTVVARQKDAPGLLYLSRETSLTDRPYKLVSTISHDPEIIVLGTSKTLAFQSSFFKDSSLFYNAGYGADASLNVNDLSAYMAGLPRDGKLRIILFDASSYLTGTSSLASTNSFSYNPLSFFMTTGWKDLYVDYIDGRFTLKQFIAAQKDAHGIGFEAFLNGNGYRADGSLDRGAPTKIQAMQKNVPEQISDDMASIDAGMPNAIAYGPTLSQESLSGIERFLEICRSRNIYVIGYLSPYATELYKKMTSLQNEYGDAYKQAPIALQTLFKRYDYGFYDMRDLSAIGSSDAELYDAEHPTEKATMRMLASLARREPKLDQYVDMAKLQKQIQSQPF